MLRIRLFEEATITLFHAGLMPAMVHLSIGQEAAIVGACLATTTTDYMTGNHRTHGHPIAKGAGLDRLMAELRRQGHRGMQGQRRLLHLADFSVGSLGESGIVGSAIPVATGAGLSPKMLGKARSPRFFGDGAANEGVFHESLNLAGVWKLPVVYLCENNGYACQRPRRRPHLRYRTSPTRAIGYGMPGVVSTARTWWPCYRASKEAVGRARRGDGPSSSRPRPTGSTSTRTDRNSARPYRDDSEVEQWRQHRDPWRCSSAGCAPGTWSTPRRTIDAVRAEVTAEVEAAVEFTNASPDPDPSVALTDLYAPTEGAGR